MTAVHRLTWVVDVEGYGRRDRDGQNDLQRRLHWVTTQTLIMAGVAHRCDRQERGDGILFVLPAGIAHDRVVTTLVSGLRDVLHEVNRTPGAGGRMRLRSALAQGMVERQPSGFQGQSVVLACYLLDDPQVKRVLADSEESDLVTVMSDDLHRDVFQQGVGEGVYEQLVIRRPEKQFHAVGWVGAAGRGRNNPRVPVYEPPPIDLRSASERRTQQVFNALVAGSSAATVLHTGYLMANALLPEEDEEEPADALSAEPERTSYETVATEPEATAGYQPVYDPHHDHEPHDSDHDDYL